MAHIAIITINDRCCIGARTLSSIAKQGGHKASLVFFGEYNTRTYESTVAYYGEGNKNYSREQELLAQLLHEIDPDVISFSFRSVSESIVADLAQGLKNLFPEKPILLGGIGATSNPNDCIAYTDYLCEGEADYMLVPFLNVFDLMANPRPEDLAGVPNLWLRTAAGIVKNARAKLVVDLDAVPFIDYAADHKYTITEGTIIRNDGRYDNEVGAYPLLSSRGCPFLCSYCHNSLVKQLYRGEKYCRRKSPEAVMRELRHEVKRNPKIQMISVYDDSFPDKKGWLDKFVPMYKKEINLPYWCYIHPEFVTERNLQLLVESRATNVAMGCQSFSERTLHMYNRPTKVSRIRDAFAVLKKFDINVQIDLISFNPLETEEDRRATFMFLLDLDKNTEFNSPPHRRWMLSISRLTLFPHTVMFDMIKEKSKTSGEFTPAVKDPKLEAFWEMLYRLTFYDFLPKEELIKLSRNYDDFIRKHQEPEIDYAIEYIVNQLFAEGNEEQLSAIITQLTQIPNQYKQVPAVAKAIALIGQIFEKHRKATARSPLDRGTTSITTTEFLQQCFNSREYAQADQFLTDLIQQSPENDRDGALSYYLGRISFYQNEFENAKRRFLQSLKQNPSHFYARFYLGRTMELLGDDVDTLRIYTDCLTQRPAFSQIADFVSGIVSSRPYNNPELALLSSPTRVDRSNSAPKVSVIILCYNKHEYTERCITSLFSKTDYPNFEVIVVDNASVDDTPAFLETYAKRITFIHSDVNLGFVGGNNLAARSASGDFIVFLNNDTEVTEGWLTELYQTFARYPDTGAAGAMLVYPNGRLQEAGGIVFQDGTGWNYGRNNSPKDPRFNFVREVDYCSGAALMVRRDVFDLLGGFDERYAPAYYEDTDLCFGVRKLGYKVRYCPFAHVVHHEGATSGTDLNFGFKRFQVLNTPKFISKWNAELKAQYPGDPKKVYLFSNRKRGKRILIVDDLPPLPDRAAGSLRLYHTVKQMVELGFQVTYVHLSGREFDEAAKTHLKELKALGVELIWFEYETWWEIRESPSVKPILNRLIASLELANRQFSLVYICFWHIASYFIDLIRQADPNVPILVDSMDLHYLRELRQADTLKSQHLRKKALETKRKELETYRKADCVTTVTENDRAILHADLSGKAVFIMTDVHDPVEQTPPFEQRRDFLYVGNFNHNPNEDAVLYFVKEIFPLIKKQLPQAKFYIVGNNPPAKVKQLASANIVVTGWVPRVEPYLAACRVSVVPLRFGAGNKGKVGETLAHGLPMVSTSIGAEGMGIVNEEHSFVADDPQQFADYAVRLHNNKDVWSQFSKAGKALIGSQYSSALMRRRIEYITSYETRESVTSKRAVAFGVPPTASIIVLIHNQFKYTKECLSSIRQFTKVNHEVIVVDNASTDSTLQGLKQFPEVRLIRNTSNLGFPAGVNVGINASLGNHIVLINNDTVVTEGWLERMIEVADSEVNIGLVGVMSNSVSGVQQDPEARYEKIDQMHDHARRVKVTRKGEVSSFPRVAFLCTLIKRSVIDRIGGLDERFTPGNFEDDDFCLRAQLAGFQTVIAKDVFIHHYGSKSFGVDGQDVYARRIETNRQTFIEKWGADPVEIWKERKVFTRRNPVYPLNKDPFIQHFERAKILNEEKELALVLSELQKTLVSFHSSERRGLSLQYTDVLNLTGNVALALNDHNTARTYFEEEIKHAPNSTRAREGLSRVAGNGKMENQPEARGAIEVCQANSDNEYDTNIREIVSQTESLSHCGRLGDAIEVLRESISAVPGNPILYRTLAWLFIKHKMFDDASDLIQQTPDTIKKNAEWLEIAGYCVEGQGFDDVAHQCVEKALELSPQSSLALTLKGVLAAKRDNDDDARLLFAQAMESDGQLAAPHLHLGALLWRSGIQDEAFVRLQKAFDLDPTDTEIGLTLYSAAESLGRLELVEARLEDAVEKYPVHKQLRRLLGDILARQGKYSKAMNVVEDAITLFGAEGDILPFGLEIRKTVGQKEIHRPNGQHETISLCMIVKNEEQCLARCLSSVKTLVDEMIVVNTGSTDRTGDIAEVFGAKVLSFSWTDDFSKARNFSLSKASGDWILVLDGDEVISAVDLEKLERLLTLASRTKRVAYSFTTRNYVQQTDTQGWVRNDGKYGEENGTGWIPSVKVRLFPRIGSIQFRGAVHELVESSLRESKVRVEQCDIPIHHYGKLNTLRSRDKGREYLKLGEKKLEEAGRADIKALSELAIQENELGNYQRALEISIRVAQLDPLNARAHMGVGSNFIGLKQFENALKPLQTSIRLLPNLNEAYIRLAIAYLALGRAAEAEPVLQCLVDANPDYPYSKAMLAAVLFCSGEKERAIAAIAEMRDAKTSFEVFFADLGRQLRECGRTEYVIALLEPLYESGYITQDLAVLLVECYKVQTLVT